MFSLQERAKLSSKWLHCYTFPPPMNESDCVCILSGFLVDSIYLTLVFLILSANLF